MTLLLPNIYGMTALTNRHRQDSGSTAQSQNSDDGLHVYIFLGNVVSDKMNKAILDCWA